MCSENTGLWSISESQNTEYMKIYKCNPKNPCLRYSKKRGYFDVQQDRRSYKNIQMRMINLLSTAHKRRAYDSSCTVLLNRGESPTSGWLYF